MGQINDLLPLVFVKGLHGATTPAMARFLVTGADAELADEQKRKGETDLEYLDRVDALYASFQPKAEQEA